MDTKFTTRWDDVGQLTCTVYNGEEAVATMYVRRGQTSAKLEYSMLARPCTHYNRLETVLGMLPAMQIVDSMVTKDKPSFSESTVKKVGKCLALAVGNNLVGKEMQDDVGFWKEIYDWVTP